MKRPLVLFLLLGTLAGAQELPITKVVLFTSGVGYFEHRGTVAGDATVPLTFTEDQVNDVLKSLILRDATGTVGVVGYPSQDPLDRSLKSFALDLGGPGGLEALLPQLRGVFLTLMTPAEVTGRLVGLDRRGPADKTETWLTLATDDGLRLVPLGSVTGMKILDPKVERELSQALALVAGSRDARKKTVTANFKGTGNRQVSVGYIAEAPVWKTTYRLDLTGGRPFLQAWAIVENTGENDWNQVKLSLVSGRPVSFIQDLYTPLYVQRPLYEPETEAGPAPRVTEAASSSAPMGAPAPAPALAKLSRSSAYETLFDESAPESLKESGVRAASSGSKAGELFQFALQAPVTLARHRSALIPLAAADLEAKKVSLYNASVDRLHPQNAVQVTNSTGLRLPAGPITVYDGGTYAGDALTDSLVEKDRRLWTYATDLTVRAEVSEAAAQSTTKVTVVRGVVNTKKELTWTTTYGFTNAGAEARTVVVEHPAHGDRNLVAPAVPTERTPDWLRFTVEAAAGARAELAVKESRTVVETQGLVGWRAEQILSLMMSNGPLSPAVKAALQKVADLRVQADRTVQAATDLDKRKTDLENGQGRIRDNLEAVGRDSAQGQNYLKRLLDSEAQIDVLVQSLADARKAQDTAQKNLEDGVRALTVE